MASDRRSFLKSAAVLAAAAAVPVAAQPPAQQLPVQQPSRRSLNGPLLSSLGETVLPESIGAPARAEAVRAFSTWIAAYTPVSEQMHGYGDAEITYTPADPAPNWNAQLEALDLFARQTKKRGFAALPLAARREIVSRQLAPVRSASLAANPLSAPHVAVALLSHWASSPSAHDAAYGARIIRGECRGLGAVARKPLPIAGGAD